MKRLILILALPLLAAILALALAACAWAQAQEAGALSDLDKATLQKDDAQLQLLQIQFQRAAEPIAKEQQDVIARVCKAAKLTYGVDCVVNADKGTVTKKEVPKK